MKKLRLWLALSVVWAMALVGCGGGGSEKTADKSSAPETESSRSPEASQAQMDFTGVDIEGKEISGNIFSESRLTMVNVWATYCNPCLSEMPGLGELAKAYDPEEFQIIGIISDVQEGDEQEAVDLAAGLIEQTGADYPHLLLNESIYGALLTDVSAVPTTFFVDADGVVLDTVVGAMEKSAWEEKVNALLEG